jgi:hypothetical protein
VARKKSRMERELGRERERSRKEGGIETEG